MHQVFVYGTLLEGERNHYYLTGAKRLYRHAYVFGELVDTAFGYPALKPNERKKTFGEIYEVSDEALQSLDQLEGYTRGASNNLYERIIVKAYNDKVEEINVFTYIAGDALSKADEEIPEGNWRVYQYLKKDSYFYFAYGSCMDDERFQLANVDQYFTDVTGRGVLQDHGFRFSRSSSDGGKADIVESKEELVEGVIYHVPKAAIDYLYKREGVYRNAYRPAIVSLQMADGKKVEAITFIGTGKSDETPPTALYATEILRGAKGMLSNSYISKLKQRIDALIMR